MPGTPGRGGSQVGRTGDEVRAARGERSRGSRYWGPFVRIVVKPLAPTPGRNGKPFQVFKQRTVMNGLTTLERLP